MIDTCVIKCYLMLIQKDDRYRLCSRLKSTDMFTEKEAEIIESLSVNLCNIQAPLIHRSSVNKSC